MATKAKKDPTEGPSHSLAEVVRLWGNTPTDKEVYEALVEAREHGLTWTRITGMLGMSRQHIHKWYWQRFRKKSEGPVAAAPPDGFDPTEDTPPLLADVAERRGQSPDHETVFRSILAARIGGATMQEVSDELGRKREQVYRDYWTPFVVDGVRAMNAAEREAAE